MMAYRGSKTPPELRDERQTPRYLYEHAVRRWGPFDIDLAATSANRLCNRCYTMEKGILATDLVFYDGLSRAWHEDLPKGRGWCNPPYSAPDAWIEKAIEEARAGFETLMLLPSLNSDDRDALILDHAVELEHIIGRVQFPFPLVEGAPPIGLDGEPLRNASNNRGSMFVRFAPRPPGRREPLLISYVRRADIQPPRREKSP